MHWLRHLRVALDELALTEDQDAQLWDYLVMALPTAWSIQLPAANVRGLGLSPAWSPADSPPPGLAAVRVDARPSCGSSGRDSGRIKDGGTALLRHDPVVGVPVGLVDAAAAASNISRSSTRSRSGSMPSSRSPGPASSAATSAAAHCQAYNLSTTVARGPGAQAAEACAVAARDDASDRGARDRMAEHPGVNDPRRRWSRPERDT